MVDLVARVESVVRGMMPRGARLLVAVSGGLDSMVLLDVLHRLAGGLGWKLVVAHFNHRLRGRASTADEDLVRKRAQSLGLPFVGGNGDVRALARDQRLSIEMAARQARHGFLAGAARKRRCTAIAMAHHLDDQEELFFLRLLRGAGGEGLAGMRPWSRSPSDPTLHLMRPLLGFSKAHLGDYARLRALNYREDATNSTLDVLRNRVRHELLPLLRDRYQPGLSSVLSRVMEITGAETEFVSQCAREWLEPGKAPSGSAPFGELPVPVQRRSLQIQLYEAGITADFELVERLRIAANIMISVGPGRWVQRDSSGHVRVDHPVGVLDVDPPEESFPVKLGGPKGRGRINISPAGLGGKGGIQVKWALKPLKRLPRFPGPEGVEWFDAHQVGPEIILRHWKPGDRFQPIGMAKPVKLQDLFVNAKVPRARRRETTVAVASSGVIFWVQGLRIGELFKLTQHTRVGLQWRWKMR